MAQGSIQPSGVQSAAGYTQAVRDALSYVATFFLGASAPAALGQPFGGQAWGDTTAGRWKRRNVANTEWVSEGVIDGFLAHGVCRALKLEVLNGDLTQVVINVGDMTVEGTYLPPLASTAIDTNTASGGVNALDTGAWATNTWYAVWAICNAEGSSRGYLASLSATSPTMPVGYTRKRRIGWIRTTGTATNLQKFRQVGNVALWNRDQADADLVAVSTASPSTTYATVTCTTSVPSTAVRAHGVGYISGNGSMASPVNLLVAPTGQGLVGPAGRIVATIATANVTSRVPFEIDLNGSRQFDHCVSSTVNVAAEVIHVMGWEDQVL